MTQQQRFPDPTTLDPLKRVELIDALRTRILNGDEPTKEELQFGVALLYTERQSTAGTTSAKREKASAKEAEATAKVDALFGDL